MFVQIFKNYNFQSSFHRVPSYVLQHWKFTKNNFQSSFHRVCLWWKFQTWNGIHFQSSFHREWKHLQDYQRLWQRTFNPLFIETDLTEQERKEVLEAISFQSSFHREHYDKIMEGTLTEDFQSSFHRGNAR